MENTILKDKDYQGKLTSFDKEHGAYRQVIFLNFMNRQLEKFINSYRFEGDDLFTIEKQKALLYQVFTFGYGGVVSDQSFIKSAMPKEFRQYIKDNELVSLGIAPKNWDVDGLILDGEGFTIPKHNFGRKSYSVSRKDCAILQFNTVGENGWYKFLPMAYLFATGETVIKKRLSLLDEKLANNRVNNETRNVNYDGLYDVSKSFLELAPSQQSIANNQSNAIDISKMLETKIAKLNFSNGETIVDLFEFIKAHTARWYKFLGVRTETANENPTDRTNAMDFSSEEVHYQIIEKDFKDMCEVFIRQYQELYGKQLTLVFVPDEIKQSEHDKQVEMAGRMGNVEPQKGDNNAK